MLVRPVVFEFAQMWCVIQLNIRLVSESSSVCLLPSSSDQQNFKGWFGWCVNSSFEPSGSPFSWLMSSLSELSEVEPLGTKSELLSSAIELASSMIVPNMLIPGNSVSSIDTCLVRTIPVLVSTQYKPLSSWPRLMHPQVVSWRFWASEQLVDTVAYTQTVPHAKRHSAGPLWWPSSGTRLVAVCWIILLHSVACRTE